MKLFKIVSLTREYADKIRQIKVDDFGYQVTEQVATGFGPCRVSLKPFVPGVDVRILISYSPFYVDNAYNQTGPVFIHKRSVEPYDEIHRFPPEIKADKLNFPLTLLGYSQGQQMIFSRLVGHDDIDLLIQEIFDENEKIEYLHARNGEAGCFICKIERY